MGSFNTKKTIFADPALIPTMGERITRSFMSEGYEVTNLPMSNGGCDISITKGGVFKAVLGMKTALKVSLTSQGNSIFFDANVGIFGQQAIPTIISMFFFWPVILTQISGLVQQAKLDDKALAIAEQVAAEAQMSNMYQQPNPYQGYASATQSFCTNCGAQLSGNPKFCPNCGTKL